MGLDFNALQIHTDVSDMFNPLDPSKVEMSSILESSPTNSGKYGCINIR